MMGISRQRIIDAVRNNIIWTKLLQPIGSDMSEAEIKAQAIRKTISEFGLTKVQTLPNALPP
jgi:hypothetical protein